MKTSRIILILVCLILAACSPAEQESALATTLEETAEATEIIETANHPQPSGVFAIASSSVEEFAPRWSIDSQSLYWVKRYRSTSEGNIRTEFYQTELAQAQTSNLILSIDEVAHSAQWSPDTQYIAYIDMYGYLQIMDRSGTKISNFAGFPSYYSYPLIWLPDSQSLIAILEDNLALLNIDGTSEILFENVEAGNQDFGQAYALSSDGSTILLVHQGELYLVPTEGIEKFKISDSDESEFAPSFSPDGSIIFVSNNSERLSIYRAGFYGVDGQLLIESRFDDFCPSWSPDGSRIAFLRGDVVGRVGNTAFIHELESGDISWIARPDGHSLGCPIWSPNSEWLAFVSMSQDIYIAEAESFTNDIGETEIDYRVTVSSELSLNVYDNPNIWHQQIGILSSGSSVELNGESADGWQGIIYQGQSAWVASQYLRGQLDPILFCEDRRVLPLIEALKEAVRNRDGEAFASLIAPQGLTIGIQGANQALSHNQSSEFFTDERPLFWGMNWNGEALVYSMAGDVLPLLDNDLLGENLTVACQDNQDNLSDNSVLYAVYAADYQSFANFYSLMRPGAPGYELDWGAWGIAFSYWDDEPKIIALGHYVWTP